MCLGLPGRIVGLAQDRPSIAWVDIAGLPREVDLALIADERPVVGDWVVVHLGYALERMDEAEARATIDLIGSGGA